MPARQIHVSGVATTCSSSPPPPTRSAQPRLVPNTDITSLSVPARWPVGVPHLPEGPRGVTRETTDTRRGAGAAVAHGYCAANRLLSAHRGVSVGPAVIPPRPEPGKARGWTPAQAPGSQGRAD